MSYDLFFRAREPGSPGEPSAIRDFFRGRPRYTEQGDQFWYENEDTGVYFSFDLSAADDPEDEGESGPDPYAVPLAFNINYYRPHFFGLEADFELSALVDRFSFEVDDPQNEGMGSGGYSQEGFLRGWNAGNLFGHHAIFNRPGDGESAEDAKIDTLPADTLERVWRWNYERVELQDNLGDSVFVPGIRLVRFEGRPQTLIVWGDAIPQAVPEADLVAIARHELAPRRLFRKTQDMCLVPYRELAPILPFGRRIEGTVPYLLFDSQTPPAEVVLYFKSRAPFKGELEGLAFDSVLTHEVVEEVRARGAKSGA